MSLNRRLGIYEVLAAPVAGTNAVQTISIGANTNGGNFALVYSGFYTNTILFANTNANMANNIKTGLSALPTIGTNNVTVAANSATNGAGTFDVTFAGALARKKVPTIGVVTNNLTGGANTNMAVTSATNGVDATGRGLTKGAMIVDTNSGNVFINMGNSTAPSLKQFNTF